MVFPLTVFGQHQPPGKPDAPTITPTDGTLAVSWTAPADSGSTAITHYYVGWRVLPHGAWAGEDDPKQCCSETLGSNLFLNKEYVVRVRAANKAGNFPEGKGPWSDTTLAIPKTPTSPSAPSKPTGTVDDSSVTLSWTMGIGDNGNSPITGWEYVKKTGSGDFETTWNTLSGVTGGGGSDWPKTYTATFTGLTNFTPYKFKVRAVNTHGDGEASPESDSLTPVVLTLPSMSDYSWTADSAVSVTLPEASHGAAPHTYSITGTLPTGVSFTASSRALAGTPSAAQDETTYTYKVRDAEGDEDTEEFTITVATDLQPSVTAVGDRNWVKGDFVQKWLPQATGGNGSLTYTLSGTLPTGMSFDATKRLISGTPSVDQTATTYTYKATDADGDEATDEFSITVISDPLSSVADQSWLKGTTVSLTLPKATAGNPPLTYTLGGTLPTGLSFSAANLTLSGTPSSAQTATTYTYKVEDWNGNEHTEKFTIEITDDTPELPTTSDQTWIKDTAVDLTLPASSGGDAPLTYSLAGSLPTGVSFDTSTRELSGTPTVTQTAATYTYKVEDANGDTDTDEFTITVEADTTPTLSAPSDQTWVVQTAVSLTLPAASGGNTPLTYSLAGLPTWASFNASTRVLSGTPSATQDAATYTYKVEDANGDTVNDEFTIEVEADTSPSLTSTSDQTWVQSTAVSLTLPESSSGNTPLTYSLAGDLPDDVSFNAATRVLSGTPSATQDAVTYTYKVRDANGDEASDSFTIEVEADASPSLTATSDQTWVVSATSVSLTLPESSSGNTPLTYSLAGDLPDDVSFNADTRVLSGTPSATQDAATYTYKVRDRDGDEASDEFTITVETDTTPTLSAPSDQTWVKSLSVSLTLPAASSGNAPFTYSLAGSLPTGVSFDASSRELSGAPSVTQTTATYTYKVRDQDGDEVSDEFTIEVEADTTPSLTSTSDQTWLKSTAVNLTLPASSSGNTPLTYSLAGDLPAGVSFTASTRVLEGTPTGTQSAATYTYKVRDRDGDEVSDEFTIEVQENTSPSLTATSDQTWVKSTAVSLTLPASSGGNTPLTYSLSGTLPTGVSFTAGTRVLAGTPTVTQTAATYTYKVRDRDGQEATDEFTIEVETDTSPSLTATSDQTWVQSSSVTITLPESSSGNTPLTYSLEGTLPTGVSFTAGTRVLTGTPSATQSAATYTYKVEDANGDEVSDEFTIEVEADATPSLTATSDQTWVENTSVSLTLPASTSGNTPLTYTLAGDLPTGVTFKAGTRVLSGTPKSTQTATTYTYKVEDANGDEASDEFTITVEDDGIPSLTAPSDQTWVKSVAVSMTLPAASGGNAPLTYSLAGTPPAGVSFDANTRVLSGTPTGTQSAATYTYKVRDRDGDEDTDKFTIAVETDTTPSLTATSDQTWVKSASVSLTLPAASSGNAPLTYSLAGTLPTGVDFDTGTRVLSGSPSATQSAATYTYKVRDQDGDEATDEFTIEVTNATPTLTGPSNQSWVKGITVKLTLPAASGGDAPLTYSLTGLPGGVSFDTGTRVLTATPTATQDADTYTYKVEDANGDTDTAEFTITVTDATPSLTAPSNQSWVKGIQVSVTLPTASGGDAPLTYSVVGSLPGTVSFAASSRKLSGTPSATQSATTYTYKVRDANGDEDTETFTIEVTNAEPTLSGATDQSWLKDTDVSVTLPAASGGDTPLTYSLAGSLPTGVSFAAATRVLSGKPTALKSTTTYTYKVRDANGDEATDEFTIAVTNATPSLTGPADQSWVKGIAVSVTLPEASGGDAPLTYSVLGSLPGTVGFAASTRILSGTPSAEQSATTYTYKVEDANGDTDTAEFTIEVEDDTEPSVTATSDQTWVKSMAVSLTLPASSSGNTPLTYSLAGLPTWASFNATTRVLSGTPNATQDATTYTYKVLDRDGDEVSDEFTIEVEDDTSPSVTATSDQTWVKSAAVSLTLPASSSGNTPLTYSLAGTLPKDVSFNASTRVLSGTPSATQTAATYTYKVRDRDGDEATDKFTIEVTNETPTLTSVANQSWLKDIAVSLTLPAASGGDAPLTYSLSGTLPTGVTFTADTRILAGTPTALKSVATYTYKVEDANGDTDTDAFTIKVANDTPTYSAASGQSWLTNIAVSLTLPAASGGDAPLTYSITGNLPAGVTFDTDSRVLSGTPTTTQTATTYTYKVEDANGDTADGEFTIEVTNATPTLSGPSDQRWIKDNSVSVTLPAASGGDSPPTYTLAGTLPTGVSFNAATRKLSGTPTATQTAATYTYKVEDKNGDEADQEFTIEVEADTRPTLQVLGNLTWVKDEAVSLTLPAASEGNAPLTYSLSGSLPTGVSFNAATRVLSGTPTGSQVSQTFTYKVQDANGDQAVSKFSITALAQRPTPALEFSRTRLTVPEGGTATYAVELAVQPSVDVTVAVTVAGDSDLTVAPSSLTFTSTTWNFRQTVTVSAAQDTDETDGTATLSHAAAGGAYASVTGTVYATEIDDDRPEPDDSGPCALIPLDSAPTKPILEGVPFFPAGPSLTSGDGELRVRLPAARTTLAPILAWNYKLDHYKEDSQPGTWTPIPEVWFMERTVPVTVKDSQALPVTSDQPATPAATPANDLLFSREELTVARGNAASYAVRLATQPTSDVTLTVAALDGADEGMTASPAQLTFSAANWNASQVVTVYATEAEGENRTATFAHSATGGGYDGVTGQVTAQEGETEKALTLSDSSLDLAEGGTLTYTAHLAVRPSSDVVLTIGRTGNADLSVDVDLVADGDQSSLTFTPANWNVPRTITVTAGVDANDLDETVHLEHSLSGDGFGRRIDGLKNGLRGAICESVYLLSVQAVNRHGVSASSTAVRATPTATTPAAPANLQAVPGPGEIELNWSDPQDATVTAYEYRYSTYSVMEGGHRGQSAWQVIEPTTRHLVEGMRFGVRYTFEVRARKGEERGAISRATAIPALADAVSRAPTGFVAAWTASGEAQLQWDAESWTGKYEYRVAADDGGTWSDWQEATSTCDDTACSSAVTVEGNSEAYQFELRRISTMNVDIATARTGAHPSAPLAPLLLVSTPEGPEQDEDRWQLTWTPSADGESATGWQYRRVYLGDENGSPWGAWTDMQPTTEEGVSSFTVLLESDAPEGQYLFQVRGTNSLGVGEPSNVQ